MVEEDIEKPVIEEAVEFVDIVEDEEDSVVDYVPCTEFNIPVTGQLHEKSVEDLAKIVTQIVDEEGPIHITEIIRRIRVVWGLKRAGKRIHDSIMAGVELAENNGDIIIRDEFVYGRNGVLRVRRRFVDPPAKINLISDEEIAKAVQIVLKTQYASPMAEIVKQTSRLFGIKVTRGATAKRIEGIVLELLESGSLELQANGMINFPKT